jgi:hypothetical protein
MEVRVGKKLAQKGKGPRSAAGKKIDCGRMLVNIG